MVSKKLLISQLNNPKQSFAFVNGSLAISKVKVIFMEVKMVL
jgi:hypothetical protein